VEREKLGENGVVELLGPRSVRVSPDGRFVYAAVYRSNAVTYFARDPASGGLTFAGFAKDNTNGVDGLAGTYGLAISPDGNHLYAAGLNEDSLVVFARNPDTGALSFVERKQDGVGGVDGLDGVSGVAVSPDGRHVYTTAFSDNAVAVFARNPATGALTFVEREKDNEGDTWLLSSPYDIAISGDGRTVLVTSATEHTLDVFRRDPATGRLFLAQLETNGVDGVSQLATPRGIALAGGVATYVASHGSNAVVVFTPEPGNGALALASLAALAALARGRARH
jgi:6-phosphogluconolactonase (cycloisomerase 2 family)